MFQETHMLNSLNSLNNVAVEYFEMGLRELSYQIWSELYQVIRNQPSDGKKLLPVISCNLSNALRRNGFYKKAGRVCQRGLKSCFETGEVYAAPELMLQLAAIYMKQGETETAKWLYSFGRKIFSWNRQDRIGLTIEEMMEQDFLLYCKE